MASCSFAERVKLYSDEERNKYTQESVLILDVTAVKSELGKRGMKINAIEKHADINYAVQFEVNSILKIPKDESAEKTFTVAVHSPTLTFGIPPWGYAKDRRYRLYLKFLEAGPSNGYDLIGVEWLPKETKK